MRSALVAMSLHFESVGSYFTQPWDAVADVLYLHVGYLFVAKILSRVFLALYTVTHRVYLFQLLKGWLYW